MKPSLSKREINRQRWRERIDAWKTRNQSQKAFCKDHHLGLASFQRWHRIFKAEETEGVTAHPAPISFLPVRVRETVPSSLTILIRDDLRIQVPPGFNRELLQQVIQVLQES
jgi:hypothetical protein